MHTHRFRIPARGRAQLTLAGVSVLRGTTAVLTDVDLTVTPASRIAVVGENGRGKTTLLHVLAGTLEPDTGSVHRVGTIGVAEQELETTDRRTVGQVVADATADARAALAALERAGQDLADDRPGAADDYASALAAAEALDAWEADRRAQIALEALGAETDFARPLSTLSVGRRYRVRLACLLAAEDDFLLLDEPTNHLDRHGLEFLTARLRARSGGVVVVSHDRALLADIAQQVVDLDPTPDGRPRVHGGGYAAHRQARRAERERWEQEYARQQDERARLRGDLEAAQDRLVSGWRPAKGHAKHGRATRADGLVRSVHRRRAELEAHAVPIPEPPLAFRFPELSARTGAPLLAVHDVTSPGRLAMPVTFTLTAGSRLVITGPNGAGKSTLLGIAAGELTPGTGAVRRGRDMRLGYLRQESDLPLDRTAAAHYRAHVDALVAGGAVPPPEAIDLAGLGLLRPGEADKRIGELSIGQRRRLDLALVLAARPQVLLLDEPTNHLSIALVDELTEALAATPAAVVVSSHDRQLLRDTGSWPRIELATASGDGKDGCS